MARQIPSIIETKVSPESPALKSLMSTNAIGNAKNSKSTEELVTEEEENEMLTKYAVDK